MSSLCNDRILGSKPFSFRTLKTGCTVFWLSLWLMRHLVLVSFRRPGISLWKFLRFSSLSLFFWTIPVASLAMGRPFHYEDSSFSSAPGNFLLTLFRIFLLSIFCSHFPEILDVRSLDWSSISFFTFFFLPVFWLDIERFSLFYLLICLWNLF